MAEGGFALERQFGLKHGIAVIMGLVVGGGIYISPSFVVLNLKSPGLTLVAWMAGGFISFMGALCFAEVGVAFPISGEKYAYLRILYSSSTFLPFLYIWQYLFLMRSGGNALKALLLGRYLLKPLFTTCEIPLHAILLVGSIFIVLISVTNMRSVKLAATGQAVMTFISVCSLCIVCSVGIYYVSQGWTETLENPFAGSTTNPSSIALGMYAAAYPFYGWSSLNFVIEELKNPTRNLPIALIISMLLVTLLYVGVNFTYLCVIGMDGVLASQAVALSTVNEVSPILGWILTLFIAITAFSSFNSGILVGSRLAFVGARYGHLPRLFSFIQIQYITPIMAIMLQCVLVLVYVWLIDITTIINNMIFSVFVFDLLVIAAFFRLKFKTRHIATDKFRAPFIVHLIYMWFLLWLIAIPLLMTPLEAASGFLFATATSLPYYFIFVKWKSKPDWITERTDSFNFFIQKLFLCAPEDA